MEAQLFNLSTERRCRVLTKATASLEADVADLVVESASLQRRVDHMREAFDDRDLDPRARALLKALRRHFAGCDGVLVEIDHLRSLLKSRSDG